MITVVYRHFAQRMHLFVNLGNEQQLIRGSALTDDTCQTRDPVSVPNPVGSRGLHELVFFVCNFVSVYKFEKSTDDSLTHYNRSVMQSL